MTNNNEHMIFDRMDNGAVNANITESVRQYIAETGTSEDEMAIRLGISTHELGCKCDGLTEWSSVDIAAICGLTGKTAESVCYGADGLRIEAGDVARAQALIDGACRKARLLAFALETATEGGRDVDDVERCALESVEMLESIADAAEEASRILGR